MKFNQTVCQDDELLDIRDLQKWNCIIEPTVSGFKSYGGLYLGDVDCAQDVYLLQTLKVGALFSVIDEPQIILPDFMKYIVHETISIPDSANEVLMHYFPRCSEFIEYNRQHTNVMVHCFAGISRSASVVIAYLMEKFDWGYDRTLTTVKAVRKQVKPNPGIIGLSRNQDNTNICQQERKTKESTLRRVNLVQNVLILMIITNQLRSPRSNLKIRTRDSRIHVNKQQDNLFLVKKTNISTDKSLFQAMNQSFQSAQKEPAQVTQNKQKQLSQQQLTQQTKPPRQEQSIENHYLPTKPQIEMNNILQVINNYPSSQVKAQDKNSIVRDNHTPEQQRADQQNKSKDKLSGQKVSSECAQTLFNLSKLEQEIQQRQNSLLELQKKYQELQTINNQILKKQQDQLDDKTTDKNSYNQGFQYRRREPSAPPRNFQTNMFNQNNQPRQPQVFHYPYHYQMH